MKYVIILCKYMDTYLIYLYNQGQAVGVLLLH